uniref:Tail tape measure protein n=1 Tax=viral metagenome TaxID=1070528 RepID=A0A6M3X7F7_9ZZZZ
MAETTQYDVQANYRVNDKATGPVKKLGKASEGTARQIKTSTEATNHLSSANAFLAQKTGVVQSKIVSLGTSLIGQMAVFAGMASAVDLLKDNIIGANVQWGRSEIRIGAMAGALGDIKNIADPMEKFNLGVEQGNRLLSDFDKREESIFIGMNKLVGISEYLAIPVFNTGKGMEKLAGFTEDVALAARGLGEDASVMAQGVMKAIEKGVALEGGKLGSAFVSLQGDKFAKMTNVQRFAAIEPIIKKWAAAGKLAISDWDKAMFQVQSSVNDMIRDVGGPVFQKVTRQFQDWARYLSDNEKTLRKIAEDWIVRIQSGLQAAGGLLSAIADNWELIATVLIGKTLLNGLDSALVKLAAMGAATAKIGVGAVGGGGGVLTRGLAGTAGGIRPVNVVNAAQIGVALGGVVVGGMAAYAHSVAAENTERINRAMAGVDQRRAADERANVKALEAGLGTLSKLDQQLVDATASNRQYLGMTVDAVQRAYEQQEQNMRATLSKISSPTERRRFESEFFKRGVFKDPETIKRMMERTAMEDAGKKGGKVARAQVKQVIQQVVIKQDFRDQDPDRVYIRFSEDLADLGANMIGSPVMTPLGGEST